MKNVMRQVGRAVAARMFDVIAGCKSTGVVSEAQEAEYYALRKGAETLFGIEIRGVLAEPLGSIVLKDDVFVALEVLAVEQDRIANDPMLVVVLKPGGGRVEYWDTEIREGFVVEPTCRVMREVTELSASEMSEELERALNMLFDTTTDFMSMWANRSAIELAKTDSHE